MACNLDVLNEMELKKIELKTAFSEYFGLNEILGDYSNRKKIIEENYKELKQSIGH